MSEQDTGNNDGGGGTGTDTGTEDEAASRLLASWMSQEDTGSGGGDTQRQQSGQEQDMASLPEWAQKQIRDLRKESGDHRTSKNEAEQKYQGTLDAIAKALGLKEDEKPDPDKLASQLTSEQTEKRDAKVQLAVYRRAATNGANPDALLDSASFLQSLTDVDPSQEQAVDEAIKAAVEKNPNLAAQRPRGFEHGPRGEAPTGSMNDLILGQLGRR